MHYLIYSHCFETPHFETEMEIAYKLKDQGHKVSFLVCDSDLKTCFINPHHNNFTCNFCKSKVANGLNFLGIKDEEVYRFNKIEISKSEFSIALESFQSLIDFNYCGSDIGLAVASSMISYTRDHSFDLNRYKEMVSNGLETALMVHKNALEILPKLKPDGVIMFNGRFLESRPMLRVCESLGIDFFTHERGGDINRYMFRINSTPHSLSFAKDEIEILWEEGSPDKFEIGKSFFEDRRNKIVQNWHIYSENQTLGQLPIGFDHKKRNIGIFNSSIDEYVTIPDFNNKLYNDDNEGIEKLCESFLRNPEFHFYLRMHPNLKAIATTQTKRIAEIAKKYKNITIIQPEDDVDSYALIESVEKVVTFGSTMGVEAIYWNKPSILLGRAYFEEIEGVLCPKSHEEAVSLIIAKNEIPNKDSVIKFGYWSISYGNEFQYFKPDSLFKGKFLNKRINASLFSRVNRKINTLLETIKS